MNKILTFLKAIFCDLISFTAPIVMLFGVWTVNKNSRQLPSFLGWYRTPDEGNLVGFYEPTISKHWKKCWRCTVYEWYGIRNRAHGVQSFFAKPCTEFPQHRLGTVQYGDGLWLQRKQISKNIQFIFGWAVYTNKEGLPSEARPVFSFKWRSQ